MVEDLGKLRSLRPGAGCLFDEDPVAEFSSGVDAEGGDDGILEAALLLPQRALVDFAVMWMAANRQT